MVEKITTDVLVVGSGAAGLCAAIAARQCDVETLIVSIASPGAGSSTAMSGGIMNAAVGPDDSPEIHFDDSIRAGVFLNDRARLTKIVETIPCLLPKLEEYGVSFYKENGEYSVTRSPGHTRARTVTFQPKRGTSLSKPLAQTAQRFGVKALSNFNLIKVLVEDGTTVGVIGYNWETDDIIHVAAKAVVLATGGASLLYGRTRIPPAVPGDGYGIALGVGLTLQDMEFVQFFPTILAEPGMPKIVITYDDFLRAGAVLRNSRGEDIVAKHRLPAPEMITRDQLAIAMAREIYEGNGVDGAVLLDAAACRSKIEGFLFELSNFARIIKERRAQGEDLLARPIRLAPANHYYMGGVVAGTGGETSIEGLLVCGEIVGGTHGANRLQANSLAETVVIGFEAGRQAGAYASRCQANWCSKSSVSEFADDIRADLQRESGTSVREIVNELQSVMTVNAAMVRDELGLRKAKDSIARLRREIPRAVASAHREKGQLCTISQLLDVAECIIVSALARTESRGAHFRLDYPERDDRWTNHVTCFKRGNDIQISTCAVKK